jgi:peptidoglycan/LPS O-acetylase OafA/YrhL
VIEDMNYRQEINFLRHFESYFSGFGIYRTSSFSRTTLMPKKNIQALTSMRFIAASMVVAHHLSGRLGLPHFSQGLALGHGVSFFFVLSGFILTWVYGTNKSINYWKFIKNRLFRIYPLHLVTFGAAVLLLASAQNQLETEPFKALLQLAIIQSWTGDVSTAMSFNGPAWSISTEFGFYLLFPLLLKMGRRIWLSFLGIAAITAALMAFAIFNPDTNVSKHIWDALHVSPAGRLIEFTFGMLLGRIVIEGQLGSIRFSDKQFFTLYELVAICGAVFFVCFSAEIYHFLYGFIPSHELARWMNRSGGFFAFGMLIVVFSFERGMLSNILRHRALVFLGEVSFAIYLIHQIVIRWLAEHSSLIAWLSPSANAVVVVVLSLMLGAISFLMIETPVRVAGRKGVIFGAKQLWGVLLSWPLRLAIVGLIIISIMLPIGSSLIGTRSVSLEFAQQHRYEGVGIDQHYVNDNIILYSANTKKANSGLGCCYSLIWYIEQGLGVNGLRRSVHLAYKNNKTVFVDNRVLVSSSLLKQNGWLYILDDFCIRGNTGSDIFLRVRIFDPDTHRPIPRVDDEQIAGNLYVDLSTLTGRQIF